MAKNQVQESPDDKQYRENVEDIACNIAKLSRQVNMLLTGRLKRKAVIILLANSSGYSKTIIDDVLKAIEGMEAEYLVK